MTQNPKGLLESQIQPIVRDESSNFDDIHTEIIRTSLKSAARYQQDSIRLLDSVHLVQAKLCEGGKKVEIQYTSTGEEVPANRNIR